MNFSPFAKIGTFAPMIPSSIEARTLLQERELAGVLICIPFAKIGTGQKRFRSLFLAVNCLNGRPLANGIIKADLQADRNLKLGLFLGFRSQYRKGMQWKKEKLQRFRSFYLLQRSELDKKNHIFKKKCLH